MFCVYCYLIYLSTKSTKDTKLVLFVFFVEKINRLHNCKLITDYLKCNLPIVHRFETFTKKTIPTAHAYYAFVLKPHKTLAQQIR
jgi:hypothetical protein